MIFNSSPYTYNYVWHITMLFLLLFLNTLISMGKCTHVAMAYCKWKTLVVVISISKCNQVIDDCLILYQLVAT